MGKKHDFPAQVVCMCMGSKCKKYNKDHYKHLKDALKHEGKHHDIEILKVECTGRCKQAPVMCLQPSNLWFTDFDDKLFKQVTKNLLEK